MVSRSQYIADLSGREFDLDVNLTEDNNGLLVETDFGLNISDDPMVIVSGDVFLKLLDPNAIKCAFAGCSLSELVINYDFMARDASLTGSSICSGEACSAGNFSHSIKTLDTQGFFLGLMDSKVFNPLALFVAQSQFQAGDEVGNGHELKF